jgi:alpha-glucosidase
MISAPRSFPIPLLSICRNLVAGALIWSAAIGPESFAQGGGLEVLKSPDARIQVSIQIPAAGAAEKPRWSATFRGRPILENCDLGLQTADAGELFSGVGLVNERRRSVDERILVLFGKSAHANDRFNETHLLLETPKRGRVELTFRCYDDAIALRYEIPRGEQDRSVIIADETTSFQVAGSPTAYVQQLEHYKTPHEHHVAAIPYRDIPSNVLLDLPLTFKWSDGTYAALTEAALRRYAGMSLMRSGESPSPRLHCKLTPRSDGTKVVRPLPMKTPWRVVLIGDRPGALLESNTIYCLNEPTAINETSWIKPGKITFSWWNGDIFDGQRTEPILSLGMARKYIDFCERNGIPTHSLTSTEPPTTPWYRQSKKQVEPGPDTDVTQPREGFDLPAIREYAKSKNVRLWTWVHQAALRGRVEEAFVAFEKMGWSGMMVDFFDHDDQETVEFAETIVEAAARHRILVQLHGVWKPTGWERTYPNLVNHEGALNLEYLKWSNRCTPEHNLMMAFTRLIAGPMDYHLGGFRSVPRAAFKHQDVAPRVLGTRCHMLAMYVCFDNSNPMIADDPAAYEGQPGFDFLKLVPTWWDETRVLIGEVGEVLVTARRKGNSWYVGGLSAKRAREIDLSLSFLGPGEYAARLWKDAPNAGSEPNQLVTETLPVSAKSSLKLSFALDGGFAARIEPFAK